MKKLFLPAVMLLLAAACFGDYKSDAETAEANFSAGNYVEALKYYRKSYEQKPDEQIAKYIAFIELKLKSNPELMKKKKNPVVLLSGKAKDPGYDLEITSDAAVPDAVTLDVKVDKAPKPWTAADNLVSFTIYLGFYQSPSFYLRYERTLFPYGSLSCKIGFNSYLFNGYIWQGKGGGLEYRHFFQGKAPNGFYAGAGAEILALNSLPLLFYVPPATATVLQPELFAGYRWIFDFGMSFDTGIGCGYIPNGTASDFIGNSFSYGGFVPLLASNVGYAW